jgi:hypothetical protein
MEAYAHNATHKAVWMLYNGRDIQVDRDMCEIMRRLWKLGVETNASCQSDRFSVSPVDPEPLAYVGFPSLNMAVQFLRLVTQFEDTVEGLQHELEKPENTNQIGHMRVALSNRMVVVCQPQFQDCRVYFPPEDISSVEYALPWP